MNLLDSELYYRECKFMVLEEATSESEETSEDASSDTESGSGETESSLEIETSADETN